MQAHDLRGDAEGEHDISRFHAVQRIGAHLSGVDCARKSQHMRVVHYPESILLTPAPKVGKVTEEVRKKALEMVPLMKLEDGIGLAAPQVGWAARLLVACTGAEDDEPCVLVDPEIIDKSGGLVEDQEGCLSFPGIYGDVARYRCVRVRAHDLDNNVIEIDAEDLFARVLQHEIDHLDGVLFISRMNSEDRAKNKPLLAELVERHQKRGAEKP
ncbi:MAG: peptide deformylase [Planctomycetes bacterium]|nr:peptide deformylase [Planctomycetota bacterium]